MSKFMAFATPIQEGKFQEWEKFINTLNTKYKKEFNESRNKLGVHERTFLQRTPHGDFVIVTLEGNDPMGAFQKMAQSQDTFTKWFLDGVKNIHGMDLTQSLPGEVPTLIADSNS